MTNSEDTITQQNTVLIVDDNPTTLSVLSRYLKGRGFRILVARSGESALRKVRYIQPDLILLDVLMPSIDGFETCKKLKANSATADIPIIFMTSSADPEDKVQGFKLGGVDYLIKPLNHDEVVARVTIHLNLRELTRNLQRQNQYLQEYSEEIERVNDLLSQQAIQSETSSRVAQQTASVLELDELLTKVVNLIQTQFEYYFVAVWMFDETEQQLVMKAYSAAEQLELPSGTYQTPADASEGIVSWVFQHGTLHLAADVGDDPKYIGKRELEKTCSELALPLQFADRIIGVLDMQSEQLNGFAFQDIVTFKALSDQIATAIRNVQLYQAEQKRRGFSETLVKTGRLLASSLDWSHVPSKILQLLLEVVSYKKAAIILQQGDGLEPLAQQGDTAEDWCDELCHLINQTDLLERIASTPQPLLIDNEMIETHLRNSNYLSTDRSWLTVPLISKYRVMGIIFLTRHLPHAFTEKDAELVSGFADQAAMALENANLYTEISQLNEALEEKVSRRTQALKRVNQDLERLNESKTDFIKVASHELRTPLSKIRGASQILQQMPSLESDDNAKELLTSIVSGVDSLHQIVNMMLDLVKIETDSLEICPEPLSLELPIGKIVADFQAVAEARQLTIRVMGVDELPVIQADPDLMKKAFYNLIVNAIKYTPDGGAITIQGRSFSSLDKGEGMIEVAIIDTGIGIDAEQLDQIFEKFYRVGEEALHSTGQTKFKGGGPGLGLAIVKGIIEAHGGEVRAVSSGYDEVALLGSQFYVCLPVANKP